MSSEDDLDFLSHVYDILKSIERDSSDTTGKRGDESSQKILEFQKKLDTVREQVTNLPGIQYSKETQLLKLEALQEKLVLKKKLLQKYKNLGNIESANLKQYLGENK